MHPRDEIRYLIANRIGSGDRYVVRGSAYAPETAGFETALQRFFVSHPFVSHPNESSQRTQYLVIRTDDYSARTYTVTVEPVIKEV